MVQLYFLSILTSSLCGYLLFAGSEDNDIDRSDSHSRLSLNNPTFHLVLGILSTVTGFLKLLSPLGEKTPYFFGDFLPAMAGVVAGFLLIFGIYRQDVYSISESQKSIDKIAANLIAIRKPLGLAILLIALLHFLFPEALFL